MYKLSDRSKDRLKGVHPFIIEVINLGIKSSPYDFGIPAYGGLRTSQDQKDLYAIGRTGETTGRKPVTYCDGVVKKSRHQIKNDGYGHAFDIYIYDHEKKRASWNVDKLSAVANHLTNTADIIAEENPEWKDLMLNWGGWWRKFKDYPHFEIDIDKY